MPDYKSNMGEVVKRITDNLTAVKLDKKIVGEVAASLQSSNLRRIHTGGKAVNGEQIGEYSTKPIYVNPKKAKRAIKGEGKDGTQMFKNGNGHKTKYFKEGYKGFRRETGMTEVDKVNLSYSGQQSKEFITEKDGDNYNVGFLTDRASKIATGNEARFKKVIYGVTKEDEVKIKEIIETDINKKLNGGRTA